MEMNDKLSYVGIMFCLAASFPQAGSAKSKERPNFVWFMAEDASKHFYRLYNTDGTGAITPNVEKLAQEGIVFNHAFCNAPVSSSARSSLFTGMYAPRAGMSWHRALEQVSLPEGAQMFPAYLKQAGYYTTNSAKTDYNCIMPEGTWDDAKAKVGDWKNRPGKDTPFFYVQTCTISHESSLHFPLTQVKKVKTKHKPKEVKLAPFHPDTELFRYTYATFYDRISDTDTELGKLIQSLEEEGELDDTFIFYFGDNGGALPGSKGYTGEQGLHVPLVIYVPKNWRDKINLPVGSRSNGFISFLDFGPTLLHLAGLDIPEHMDGKPFLGKDISAKDVEEKDTIYGYGDRFDELYAFNRTLRAGNLKYSRNFVPYQPKGFYAFYRYKMEAFKQWEALFKEEKLNDIQSAFFLPQAPEELYDISSDPYETNNLAYNPDYADKLIEMRGALRRHMLDVNDLGLIPESEWLEGKNDPVTYGRENKDRISKYSTIADLQLFPFEYVENRLKRSLASSDPAEVFWALTTAIYFGSRSQNLHEEIIPLINHPSPMVKSRVMVLLTLLTKIDPSAQMKEILKEARSGAESLQILGDIAYMKEYIIGPVFKLTKEDIPFPAGSYEWRVDFINDKNIKNVK